MTWDACRGDGRQRGWPTIMLPNILAASASRWVVISNPSSGRGSAPAAHRCAEDLASLVPRHHHDGTLTYPSGQTTVITCLYPCHLFRRVPCEC
jgi:hypothetical protein